jgi:hypothetical protein
MPRSDVTTYLEAEVAFNATLVKGYEEQHDSYDIDFASVELVKLRMFGRDWTESELRLRFGDQGAVALIGLIADHIEDLEDD